MNNTEGVLKNKTPRAERHETGPSASRTVPRRFSEWGIVLIIAVVYLTHVTPGHNFRDNDFGHMNRPEEIHQANQQCALTSGTEFP